MSFHERRQHAAAAPALAGSVLLRPVQVLPASAGRVPDHPGTRRNDRQHPETATGVAVRRLPAATSQTRSPKTTTGGTVCRLHEMKQLFQCPRGDTHLNHTLTAQRLSGGVDGGSWGRRRPGTRSAYAERHQVCACREPRGRRRPPRRRGPRGACPALRRRREIACHRGQSCMGRVSVQSTSSLRSAKYQVPSSLTNWSR